MSERPWWEDEYEQLVADDPEYDGSAGQSLGAAEGPERPTHDPRYDYLP